MPEREIPVCRKAISGLRRTENRAEVRYPCNVEISIQLLSGRKDGTWRPARIKDISAKGLGLLLDSSVEPGTIVSVKLKGAAQRFSRPLLVRVKRAREQPGGGWHIGGTFALPLDEDDLRVLLPSSSPLPASAGKKKQAPPRESPPPSADTDDPFVQGGVYQGLLFRRRQSDVPSSLSTVSFDQQRWKLARTGTEGDGLADRANLAVDQKLGVAS